MIEIPKQLQSIGFRFIKLNGKIPVEKDWTTKNNYSHNDASLIEWLEKNQNYGVVCGRRGLIILDFDDKAIYEAMKNKLPNTFTVTSAGRQLPHIYLYISKGEPINRKIKGLDIRGEGSQVVGANSIIGERSYTVTNDIDIATITQDEVEELLGLKPKEPVSIKKTMQGTTKGNRNDSLFRLACKLENDGIDQEDAKVMLETANQKNKPKLKDAEINTILNSAYKYRANHEIPSINKAKIDGAIIALNAGKTVDTGYELAKLLLEESKYIILEKGIHYLWHETKYKYEVCDVMDILTRIKNNYQTIIIADPSNKQKIINGIGIAGREQAYTIKELDIHQIQFKDEIININPPIEPNKFYTEKEYFELALTTKIKATPTLFCTNPIPHRLGKSIETPKFDKMFTEWVGLDQIEKLYEMLAYCILRDYPLHKIFYLLGEGANGKSTFLRVIAKFVGEDNVCSTSLTLLSNDFGTSALHRKLVCQMGETNADKLESTDLLKKLTGEDLVPIQYKHKDLFNYRNYAKLIIATNHLPETSDQSDGWSRRCIIIDFPNQFDGKTDPLLDVTEEDWENLALKSVMKLQHILKNREFNGEGTIADKRARYRSKSNPLEAFLNENYELTFDEDQKIPCGEILGNFHDYLRERKVNIENWGYRRVSNYMKEKGIKTEKQYSKYTKKDMWFYLGIITKQLSKNDKMFEQKQLNSTITTITPLSTFVYAYRDKSSIGSDGSDDGDSRLDEKKVFEQNNGVSDGNYVLENNVVPEYSVLENNIVPEDIVSDIDIDVEKLPEGSNIGSNKIGKLFEQFKQNGYQGIQYIELINNGFSDEQLAKYSNQGIIFEEPAGIINLLR